MFIFLAQSSDVFNIGDVRTRHSENLTSENTKPFFGDPEDPSAAVLKVGVFNIKNHFAGHCFSFHVFLPFSHEYFLFLLYDLNLKLYFYKMAYA